MKRVLICLVLTLACAFGSYMSFMSNDYGPLTHWMAYYKEYREIQGALDKGNASKAELLAKLKAMYPEKADQIEAQFKAKYGSLKDSAEDAGDTVKAKWDSYTRDDNTSRSRSQSQSQSQNRNSQSPTSRSSSQSSSQNSQQHTNHASDRDHTSDSHDNNRTR
ncbi:MAG: hypothetical protein SPG75_02010 [Megasphaera elsdenii]|nr:hypothetical protein [Megasphaera elsdenii]MDY5382105.1 hypothetical protein [Megasphaera elsdenii]